MRRPDHHGGFYLPRFTLALLCPVLLLVGSCGGGDSGGEAPQVRVLEAVRATPLESAAVVRIGNHSVDFRDAPDMFGKSVEIARIVDNNLNVSAVREQRSLRVDMSDAETLTITLSNEPASEKIAVQFDTGSKYANLPGTKAIVIYYYYDPGDAEDGWQPLETTKDPNSGRVTANLPLAVFRGEDGQPAVATLRVGIADTFEEVVAASQTRSAFGAKARPPERRLTIGPDVITARCPLNGAQGCVEISMFNPNRRIPQSGKSGHKGTDFAAEIGTEVVGLQGATLTRGSATGDGKDGPIANGKFLEFEVLEQGRLFTVTYLHLSEIMAPFGNDKTVNLGTTVSGANTVIAKTGNTGGKNGKGVHPHLHVQVKTGFVRVNRIGCPATTCNKVVTAAVDPFPALIKKFSIRTDGLGPAVLLGQSVPISAEAVDVGGMPISSAVRNPVEFPGGTKFEPTRKVCLTASDATTFAVNVIGDTAYLPDPEISNICWSWGARVTIQAVKASVDAVGQGAMSDIGARYSVDATKPIGKDPLSDDLAVSGLQSCSEASTASCPIPGQSARADLKGGCLVAGKKYPLASLTCFRSDTGAAWLGASRFALRDPITQSPSRVTLVRNPEQDLPYTVSGNPSASACGISGVFGASNFNTAITIEVPTDFSGLVEVSASADAAFVTPHVDPATGSATTTCRVDGAPFKRVYPVAVSRMAN